MEPGLEEWELKLRVDVVKHTACSSSMQELRDNLYRCLLYLLEKTGKKWTRLKHDSPNRYMTKQRLYKLNDMLCVLKHGFRNEVNLFLLEFSASYECDYLFVD